MSISLDYSLTGYAKSLEGTALKEYSSLSSKVLRSKPDNSKSAGENSNVVNSNTEKKVVTRNSEVFYNNYLLNTSSDKSYVIDGAVFTSQEVEAVRSVLQNAVSPLSEGKIYYDYKDYAQMGIAENTVAKYAAENLTEEQADVVNKSLSGYISSLLDKEKEWINSECYIDDTKGVGDTGEMNTYYGVRHSIPQWIQDEMDESLAKALAKFNTYRKGSDSKEVSNNNSAENKSGALIYCASNKELAGSVRSLFAGTDITDAGQLADAFKEYKDMMTAAYRAVGFGRTSNDMLNDDTNSFTKQISNMKALISGIKGNGVDTVL